MVGAIAITVLHCRFGAERQLASLAAEHCGKCKNLKTAGLRLRFSQQRAGSNDRKRFIALTQLQNCTTVFSNGNRDSTTRIERDSC